MSDEIPLHYINAIGFKPITVDMLKSCIDFPEPVTGEQLKELCKHINHYAKHTLMGFRHRQNKSEEENFKKLKTANAHLLKAYDFIKELEPQFTKKMYKHVFDEPLQQMLNCLLVNKKGDDIKKPSIVIKSDLINLFQIVYIECKKIHPELKFLNGVSNNRDVLNVGFCQLCSLIAERMGQPKSADSIQSYLKEAKKEFENLHGRDN